MKMGLKYIISILVLVLWFVPILGDEACDIKVENDRVIVNDCVIDSEIGSTIRVLLESEGYGELDISGSVIEDNSFLNGYEYLYYLDISNTNQNELPLLSSDTHFQYLDVSHTSISSIDEYYLDYIEYLDISDTNIRSLVTSSDMIDTLKAYDIDGLDLSGVVYLDSIVNLLVDDYEVQLDGIRINGEIYTGTIINVNSSTPDNSIELISSNSDDLVISDIYGNIYTSYISEGIYRISYGDTILASLTIEYISPVISIVVPIEHEDIEEYIEDEEQIEEESIESIEEELEIEDDGRGSGIEEPAIKNTGEQGIDVLKYVILVFIIGAFAIGKTKEKYHDIKLKQRLHN